MPRSDLPFGSEFSPSQINLIDLLEVAKEYQRNWKGFERAIREKYFESYKTGDYNKGKLANNTKLGMIAYGLINRDVEFTELGNCLYSLRSDESRLYREFARHILLNLNGIILLQCVRDLQMGDGELNLVTLRQCLSERGIKVPRGGKHPSIMRLWLEKAGVFIKGWHIDEAKLQEILGISSEDIDILSMFTLEQRAYLKTIANMEIVSGSGEHPSNCIEELASKTYGVKFNEKMLPKTVLYPLQKAGYIILERGTKKDGRGAKPFIVKPTDKLKSDIILPLIEQIENQTVADIQPLLRKPLREILDELHVENAYIRGLALESLAFKLMRLIDLTYIATRLRGNQTGGAEVDLIFETDRLVFSRWQVQCKNAERVSLDDVAKEVGLTHLLKSNVIVIVSTGDIGREARRYANTIMKESNLCIVMIDHADIQAIEKNPGVIVNVFNREAKNAMDIKKLAI